MQSVACIKIGVIGTSTLEDTDAGFTFESAAYLRQMLQCPRQTVIISTTYRQPVHDKFLETEWRRFRMCRRQCLQLLLVQTRISSH